MDNIKSQKSIKTEEILKQSFFLYKENFYLFIGIAILGCAFALLHGILFPYVPHTRYTTGSFIIKSASFFVRIWADIALITAVSSRYLNNETTIRKCFFNVNVKGKYWNFIVATFGYVFAVIGGSLLFLIPGIYLGTIYSLAPIAVVLEKKGIKPFELSKVFVKGSFWRVFPLCLLCLIPSLLTVFLYLLLKTNYHLINILTHIFYMFCWSFLAVVMVVLYHRLKEKREGEQFLQKAGVPINGEL